MADAQLSQLPINHQDERNHGRDGEENDEVRGEPVVLLTLVEQELKRTESQAQQAEAQEIELDPAPLRFGDLLLDPRRIFDNA